MEKGKIRLVVALLLVVALASVLFGVLYHEEEKRLAKAGLDRQAFLEEQQALEQRRQQYLEGVAGQKAASRAGMADAKQQYTQLLQGQSDAIAKRQTITTQTTTVPVQTQVTNPAVVAKPTPARKTKTS